jgi:hypothetical protein
MALKDSEPDAAAQLRSSADGGSRLGQNAVAEARQGVSDGAVFVEGLVLGADYGGSVATGHESDVFRRPGMRGAAAGVKKCVFVDLVAAEAHR